MKIALCGNPNVGKTTLFNRLTKSDAAVGNWHGVTVEAKSKRISSGDIITDLPGSYSLFARTREEEVTRDSLLYDDFDVVVCVCDVNNLRHNLYFLLQVLETGCKAVLAVNMMDEAPRGVDLALLRERLGIPVIGVSIKSKNIKSELIAAAALACAPELPYLARSDIARVVRLCNGKKESARYLAIKAIERDEFATNKISDVAAQAAMRIDRDLPSKLRYEYIDTIIKDVIGGVPKQKTVTRKIDAVVLNKYAALPIFAVVMAIGFMLVFEAAKPCSAALSHLINLVAGTIRGDGFFAHLMRDGVLGGVGAVVCFLPQVILLFVFTALLSDSGYMSRVAFVTDGFFKKLGLSGRSAFSVILGLGCSATAVMSARGIPKREAKRIAFAVPLCPCSARLAVFTAIAAYFGLSGLAVAALYALGIAAAVCVLFVMRLFGAPDAAHMIMEMPLYRIPAPKRILKTVYRNAVQFLLRVGSIVLAVSVIVWILSSVSIENGFTANPEHSIMKTLAGMISPLFHPLGFGNWQATAALLAGFAAKETVVAVIGGFGGCGAVFGSSTAAVSFLIFVALYTPCSATIAVLKSECGGKSAAMVAVVHFAIAYAAAFLYYRSVLWFATDMRLFFTLWACVAVAVGAVVVAQRFILSGKRRKKTEAAWAKNLNFKSKSKSD